MLTWHELELENVRPDPAYIAQTPRQPQPPAGGAPRLGPLTAEALSLAMGVLDIQAKLAAVASEAKSRTSFDAGDIDDAARGLRGAAWDVFLNLARTND